MIFTLLYYLNKVKGYLQLLLCEAPKRGTRDDFRCNNTVLYYCSIEPITGDVGHVSTNHVLLAVNALCLNRDQPIRQGESGKACFSTNQRRGTITIQGNDNYTGGI